jgi:hypothetical protein
MDVLKYDYWTCKLCDETMDALSKFVSDEQKTNLLVDHIRTRHKNSRDVDQSLDEKYLVLYFTPKIEIIQDNKKNAAEVKRVNDTLH